MQTKTIIVYDSKELSIETFVVPLSELAETIKKLESNPEVERFHVTDKSFEEVCAILERNGGTEVF